MSFYQSKGLIPNNRHTIFKKNANSIYDVPSLYSKYGLDESLLKHLGYKSKNHPLDLKPWHNLLKKIKNQKSHVKIAVVGKYTNLKDSYKSLSEALMHGGIENSVNVKIDLK